jgi:YaaC-like Protein
MVAAATESPLFEGPVTLSRLWASLPGMPKHPAVIGDAPKPLTLLAAEVPTTDPRELMLRRLNPTRGYFLGVPAGETDAVLADYPTAAGYERVGTREDGLPASAVQAAALAAMRQEPEAILRWPSDGGGLRPLNEIGDAGRLMGERSWSVRPRIGTGDGPPPSQLTTMWALLYGLSHLARYQPAVWVGALDLDRAETAVHLGHGLDAALEEMPQLVHGALIGRDVLFRLALEEATARAEAEAEGGLPDDGAED